MKTHAILPKRKQKRRPPNRLQRWWERHCIHYTRTVESVPFDWSEPDAGCYPLYRHAFRWHDRCTEWTIEQRQPHQIPTITWNSEHLAYWFGERSGQSGHQSAGQDVDLDVYTLESTWWGTHHYSE